MIMIKIIFLENEEFLFSTFFPAMICAVIWNINFSVIDTLNIGEVFKPTQLLESKITFLTFENTSFAN